MKILFAGTPDFAVESLKALMQTEHDIVGVYTQPDRPAGRGRKLTASPVKQFAQTKNLFIHQPTTLRDANEQQKIRELNVDAMIVVAYGLILPAAVLSAPRLGCFNVHASLLPRWRGAAPIQHAILAGDTETGVTIMQMEQGLDTGPMLARVACDMTQQETGGSLHDKLAVLGATLLVETLQHLPEHPPEKQNNALATYAHKITREDARIDWQASATDIDRKIRAFNPWPVAFTPWQNEQLRIWRAEVISLDAVPQVPGTILKATKEGIDIVTGQGILRVLELQLPGGRVLSSGDILNARREAFLPGLSLI
ncbi:MAG: methionyl-tRNA formyltransferase [Gammaproteobacteria bacterium]|nr:methionyl-tRNA formyltransferase [Gammaproteobacteria bacterium]